MVGLTIVFRGSTYPKAGEQEAGLNWAVRSK